jgi:hypothetical protein|eukprot:SAG25_NODE_158_length_13455_cov_15.344714_23_plen_168_part_00
MRSHHRWEAGHREVGIYRWLGRIQAGGVTGAILSSMDFLPTIAALSGLHLPTERDGQPLHFDGMDVSAVLFQSNSQRASQPVVAHTKLFHPACACGSVSNGRPAQLTKAPCPTDIPPSCTGPTAGQPHAARGQRIQGNVCQWRSGAVWRAHTRMHNARSTAAIRAVC